MIYRKPDIRHLPAAVFEFRPRRGLFYRSLSQTTSSTSLLRISPSFNFHFLPFAPFPSSFFRSILLLSSQTFSIIRIKLHENNCSSSMCLELRSSPGRLHRRIRCGASCFLHTWASCAHLQLKRGRCDFQSNWLVSGLHCSLPRSVCSAIRSVPSTSLPAGGSTRRVSEMTTKWAAIRITLDTFSAVGQLA